MERDTYPRKWGLGPKVWLELQVVLFSVCLCCGLMDYIFFASGEPEEDDDPEGAPGQAWETQREHATGLEGAVRGLQVGVAIQAVGEPRFSAESYPSLS